MSVAGMLAMSMGADAGDERGRDAGEERGGDA